MALMRLATPPLAITDAQREVLEKLSGSRIAAHREVQRACALLMAGQGVATTQVAAQVGVSPATVTAWRERFVGEGLKAFAGVRPGRGRKPSIASERIAEIVHATLHEKPVGETHWSCRSMARAYGVSPATVQRIWSARGLQPHRVETFKLSNDKRFGEACRSVPEQHETETEPLPSLAMMTEMLTAVDDLLSDVYRCPTRGS